jgi:hypothetical protein
MDGNGGPTEIEHMQNSDEHAEKLAENHPEYDVVKITLMLTRRRARREVSVIRMPKTPLIGRSKMALSL